MLGVKKLLPPTCITLNLIQRDSNKLLAGTTLYLFEQTKGKLHLRQGHYKLMLWPGNAAHYPADPAECRTNGILEHSNMVGEEQKLCIVEKVC